jgi:hypothetical protein
LVERGWIDVTGPRAAPVAALNPNGANLTPGVMSPLVVD